MASTRFGYLDDFTQKNTNVGIGTSSPQDKMEVIGETRSQDLKVAGSVIKTIDLYGRLLNCEYNSGAKFHFYQDGSVKKTLKF